MVTQFEKTSLSCSSAWVTYCLTETFVLEARRKLLQARGGMALLFAKFSEVFCGLYCTICSIRESTGLVFYFSSLKISLKVPSGQIGSA
jgi:hypothetical protein